jgi:HK97 family phage portal protein
MRTLLARTLLRLAGWLQPKSVPGSLTGSQWTGTSYTDSYRRHRNPTPNELLAELKGTAWTCASINASVCAAYPPHLYVVTHANQARPKCGTRPIAVKTDQRLRSTAHLAVRTRAASRIEEVTDHPLLTLLQRVNAFLNSFDLWELTTLYQEVTGSAYWYLDIGALGIPEGIWVLPAQNVTARRNPNSRNVVDSYVYRTGATEQHFRPDQIIHFRYPDPRDPYTNGLSPLRACFEQVALTSTYSAFKTAKFANHAVPDALVSPDEVLGEEERDRLETQWNQKLRQGGSGRVVVAETGLKVQLLAHSMGDLAALADLKATKEDIANAFHIPLSFLTSETNLANLQAAEHQHMAKAINPRLQRRDEKLNEQLLPLYDPTGRLFVASEDPVPINAENDLRQTELDLKYGVVSINEVRGARGLEPVAWGNVPWLPDRWLPTDETRTTETADAQSDDTQSATTGISDQ